MICPLSLFLDIAKHIDMAVVDIQVGISREICHLLPPGVPLIEYGIQLNNEVSVRRDSDIVTTTYRHRN